MRQPLDPTEGQGPQDAENDEKEKLKRQQHFQSNGTKITFTIFQCNFKLRFRGLTSYRLG